ncbi:enoyl-CoA hydratase/isomerase family protein [Mycobacteroides abscessus]|uniref:enoyl-CoA hydratase/isomerase family protein n=1 Tax=Mycobacteroides abscessus TaxID=36809 RepID=UPI000308A533|nr:enoyl-CoA hydratase-related protein [Mycobacteroides abscessus]ORA30847.1 enoyl-CoA hydratase [Mycobacteroides abscessus subsp. bolletii]TPF67690.1 enoyl-CoA hydratase [Mycobacteroides abscessus subsp. bolletii]
MNHYRTLAVTYPKPGIALATLQRPERLNAISLEMFDELRTLQADIDQQQNVRVLVITGRGRAFCAGLDLDDAQKLPSMSATDMLAGQQRWAEAITGFRTMQVPVIAAVNGAAAGAGMGLALAADIRIASADAKFNAAFVRVGLSGGDVGTSWALPRIVGLGRAAEMSLTGRFVLADEALRIGLVTSVTSSEDLLATAYKVASMIIANSPLGMRLTKQVLQENVDAPSMSAALAVENRNQVLATRTSDMSEALLAFREKRPAIFTDQ